MRTHDTIGKSVSTECRELKWIRRSQPERIDAIGAQFSDLQACDNRMYRELSRIPLRASRDIIDEWGSVQAPPPPVLKPVTIDRKTTALLMLDFNQQACNAQRRPRCIAPIPKVKRLLSAARAAGVPVIYSVGGGGKREDIAKELAPLAEEPVVSSGVDKFRGTDLEKLLKGKGVMTVIVVGTAAHGAVLYTASDAAMRG